MEIGCFLGEVDVVPIKVSQKMQISIGHFVVMFEDDHRIVAGYLECIKYQLIF